MSMKWTSTYPTTPGFYYWQGGRLDWNQVAVVQVVAFRDSSKPLEAQELCVSPMWKNAPPNGPVALWGGRWAGPLPEPYY